LIFSQPISGRDNLQPIVIPSASLLPNLLLAAWAFLSLVLPAAYSDEWLLIN